MVSKFIFVVIFTLILLSCVTATDDVEKHKPPHHPHKVKSTEDVEKHRPPHRPPPHHPHKVKSLVALLLGISTESPVAFLFF